MKHEIINTPQQSGVKVFLKDSELFLSWSDFWYICRVGTIVDTMTEVEEYLSANEIDISENEKGRVVKAVIDSRLSNENEEQIYDAIRSCIGK